MENCCDSFLKYLIFICNFIVLFSGLLLIGVGGFTIYHNVDYTEFFMDASPSPANAGIVLVVLGAVVVLMGFCGCCGAVTENACMMFSFATMLALVVLIELGVAVGVYLETDYIEDGVERKMIEGMSAFNTGPEAHGVTEAWNSMQIDLGCCGVTNYTNWKDTPFGKGENVPDSCCRVPTDGCGAGILTETDVSEVYTQGCLGKVIDTVESNKDVFLGVGAGIVLMQVLGVLVSCMLAANMRRRANYV